MQKDKPSILVIDDEPVIASLINDFLRPRGYTVYTAYDGIAGIEVFKEKNPDIVILDILMPKMIGTKVKDEIKAINPNCKIIITSGHAEPSEYIKEGDVFLKKPFNIQELSDVIKLAEEGLKK
ncbi:hypothetical protein JZK55_16180 [Dissulfurispira thermophila]|uniref:Response regulatory domain-containing protein n=2 Tax=root TaxID=1 RepID=A0A7G1H440_9BACT|nr:response regulator [Dissulfurispira thermophila]BCB96696.1 hypothetical protein JZK55_16180 [Dissulfurispira thermophila]